MDKEEIWADIAGFDGKYKISTEGNVLSMNYLNTGKPHLLKKKINKYGFAEVKLSKNNIAKDYMVSRLMGETFIPNPLFKDIVMHKSKNKLDDSVDNLRWAYYSEEKHNTYNKGCRKIKGTKNKISYKGKSYKSYKDLALANGINVNTFYQRLYLLNWNIYEALEVPVGKEMSSCE